MNTIYNIKYRSHRSLQALLKVCLAAFLTGCSTLISDEFPEYDPRPVLNSILVAGQPLQAHVSYAEKIDTTYLEGTGEADVYFASDQTGPLQLMNPDSGYFYHAYTPQPGETVTLRADLPGYDEIYAVDTIPAISGVTLSDYDPRAGYNEDGNIMAGITIQFRDDPATRDYYELIIRKREEDRTWNIHAFNNSLDILLNEGIDPYSTSSLVFSDALFTDREMEMKLDFYRGSSGKRIHCDSINGCYQLFNAYTLYCELRHVSASYYRYKKQFYLYEKARNTQFLEGTAIAISNYANVTNGLGVVAAYAASIDSLFFPKDSVLIENSR